MALWFSGASTQRAPADYRDGPPASGRGTPASVARASHLDVGTLTPSAVSRPYGKRRGAGEAEGVAELMYNYGTTTTASASENTAANRTVTPRRTGGAGGGATTPRQAMLAVFGSHLDSDLQPREPPPQGGLKMVKLQHMLSPSRTWEKNFSGPPPPSAVAPFASELNNKPAVPYVAMRKKVSLPAHDASSDGDAFVLKRSRTPPPGAKFQETESEGFTVLLASSQKSRANPQMVLSTGYGRSTIINAERHAIETRNNQEELLERARRLKSERAYRAEQERIAQRTQPERRTGLARSRTPPATANSNGCPFATNLPVPRDPIGKPCIRQSYSGLRRVVN